MSYKNDLKILSKALDSKFQIGQFRFGYDGLVGLVPVAGDAITMSLSMYIVLRALQMRYPTPIILKMTVNVLTENIIGLIPIVGNIFDFVWKSNLKNISLLEEYDANPVASLKSAQRSLLLSFVALIGLFIITLYILIVATVAILRWLF